MKTLIAFVLAMAISVPAFAQLTGVSTDQLTVDTAIAPTDLFTVEPAGALPNKQASANVVYNYVQHNTIDAFAQSGADMCAKINAAATALNAINAGGGTIDARGFNGTQTCHTQIFSGWPGGYYDVRFGNVTVVTDFPVIIPRSTHVIGQQAQDSSQTATVFQVSNSFLTATPNSPSLSCASGSSSFVKVTFGNAGGGESLPSGETTCNATSSITVTAPCTVGGTTGATRYYVYAATSSGSEVLQNGTSGTTCGSNYSLTVNNSASTQATPVAVPVISLGSPSNDSSHYNSPSFGNQVEYVTAFCQQPNGTVPSGTVSGLGGITGFFNFEGQQASWWRFVKTWGCWNAFDVESVGAQNSGPYVHMDASGGSLVGAASTCLMLGHNVSGTFIGSTFTNVSCGSHTGAEETVSIYLDAEAVTLENLDLENNVTAISIGTNHSFQGSIIREASCGNDSTTTCVSIAGGNSGTTIVMESINNFNATNTIADPNTNGAGTVTFGTKSAIALYLRSAGNTVIND